MASDATDEFFNVGTGRRTSLKTLAQKILKLTKCDLPIEYKPNSQATLVKNRIGCPKKAAEKIGFEASIDLDDGLQRLIDWRALHKKEVETKKLNSGI